MEGEGREKGEEAVCVQCERRYRTMTTHYSTVQYQYWYEGWRPFSVSTPL